MQCLPSTDSWVVDIVSSGSVVTNTVVVSPSVSLSVWTDKKMLLLLGLAALALLIYQKTSIWCTSNEALLEKDLTICWWFKVSSLAETTSWETWKLSWVPFKGLIEYRLTVVCPSVCGAKDWLQFRNSKPNVTRLKTLAGDSLCDFTKSSFLQLGPQ